MHYVIIRVVLLTDNSEIFFFFTKMYLYHDFDFVLFVFPIIVGLIYLYANILADEIIIKRM